MRRVAVMGPSGSGKTTVSRRLARELGVPHVELDALFHGPGWTQATAEELRDCVLAAVEGRDAWVVDGNYGGKLGNLVLERADTVVWLDLPLHVCLARLWRRTSARIRDDVELWNGNRETWRNFLVGRDSLVAWTIRVHTKYRHAWPARFAALPHLRVIRLRTQRDVDAWLVTQAPASAPG